MNQEDNLAGSSGSTIYKEGHRKPETASGKRKLADLTDQATAAVKAQLDSGLSQAGDRIERAAKILEEAHESLEVQDGEGLAAHAGKVASTIKSAGTRLRNSSLDQLTTDARELARSNPVLFLISSVVLGFVLTRFLRASARIYEENGPVPQVERGATIVTHPSPET